MSFRRLFSSRAITSSDHDDTDTANIQPRPRLFGPRDLAAASSRQRAEDAPSPQELRQPHTTNTLVPTDGDIIDVNISRCPTYQSHGSNETVAPPYTLTPINTAPGREGRIRAWSDSVFSATGMSHQDSSTVHEESPPSNQDTSSSSGVSTSASSSGPRYVHYRIYTQDGAVISKSSADSGDPSLGCILGRSVAPPHTVALLKKRLCSAEGIDDHTHVELFLSCAAQSPMDDKTRLSLLTSAGPGSLPREPLALVVNNGEPGAFNISPEFANSRSADVTTLPEPRYLYYRIYRDIGEVPCKKPVNSSDPFLSRMNVNFITPPHTVDTIKRCLCFAEQMSDYQDIQLFIDLSSESGLDGHTRISILTGDGPGFVPDNPMAVVQSPPQTKPNPTEKTYRLKAKYNRRLYPSECSCTKIFKIFLSAFYSSDPQWLGHSVGEILTYDGIKRSREYYGTEYSVYLAEKASGQKGYVFASWCEHC